MKIYLIFNPTAKGARARRFIKQLPCLGYGIELASTQYPTHAIRLAQEAVLNNADVIIAAGGDGTVSEIIAGILNVPGATERVKVGIIPLGTSNVFATELGIPLDLYKAWDLIANHNFNTTKVDVPILTATNELGEKFQRAFIQLGGAGFDSLAIAKVRWGIKKIMGPFAYAMAAAFTIIGPLPQITVEVADQTFYGQLVLFGNGSYYGGNVRVFPKARFDDNMMDIRIFKKIDFVSLAHFVKGWICGGEVPLQSSHMYLQASSFSLNSEVPVPIEVDGDNIGWLPAQIMMSGKRISIITP